MPLNYVAIIIAAIVQFVIGAVWYTAFGKIWGKIHGFDKLPKEEQQRLMKGMGPTYGIQFVVTFVLTFVLAIFIANQPSWNPYAMAGFFWVGFIVPSQVSDTLFSNIAEKWKFQRVAIQAGASLICIEAAAAILHFMR